MRQLTLLFLIIFTLTSCTNKATSKIDTTQVETLKHNFIPNLKGSWVLTEYIDQIEQTKSPLKASDELKGIVAMIVPQETEAEKIEVSTSWNNHEGSNFTTYFKPGHHKNSLQTNIPDYDEKTNYYELGYESINKENFLFLYHFNKENQLLDKKQFSKVAEAQNNNEVAAGLQETVNEKIFEGNYSLTDEKNSQSKVSFKRDGSLINFPGYKTYFILTDFLGGPDNNLNQVCFNLSEPDSKCFAFEIKDNTIFLYNTHSDETKGILILDKVAFKLIKE